MELLLLLVIGHIIADFYVQRQSWIECRDTYHFKSKGLFLHVLSHFLLMLIVLFIAGYFTFFSVLVAFLVAISHYFIDVWKSYQKLKLRYFLIDQILHLLVLLLAWILLSQFSLVQIEKYILTFWNTKSLAVLCAYIIVGRPTSFTIGIALRKYAIGLEEPHSSGTASIGLQSAGKLIGYLERWLIVSFILVEQFAGVGFLLAAKTIFRFGDLTKNNDRKMTEYMLLGTLISFFIGLIVGWIVLKSVF